MESGKRVEVKVDTMRSHVIWDRFEERIWNGVIRELEAIGRMLEGTARVM